MSTRDKFRQFLKTIRSTILFPLILQKQKLYNKVVTKKLILIVLRIVFVCVCEKIKYKLILSSHCLSNVTGLGLNIFIVEGDSKRFIVSI